VAHLSPASTHATAERSVASVALTSAPRANRERAYCSSPRVTAFRNCALIDDDVVDCSDGCAPPPPSVDGAMSGMREKGRRVGEKKEGKGERGGESRPDAALGW
jgi:hypothetical protein